MSATAALPVPARNIGPVSASFIPRSGGRGGGGGSSHFCLSKPSWIVKSESNVRLEKFRKPDPPCVVCDGSGRVDCHHCRGRGRTNCVHLVLLPEGEWPKWCKVCGGSGLGYCNRCLGTGEYRDIMGFHFMKMNTNRS
ncbi:uncharacterized protein LOC109825707 [Asparagus officinalis]|uniref:uncharacterized protein LOC109825707 n=1 Tax=Asparagus officinalis TaxID=4686 RepID=UPI00098DFDB9|nr:uncharacterized protein LOC109825707 [Asparagus officinalis]